MAKKIYVGNLSWGTTNDSLKAAFEQFGAVEESVVMIDKMTGRSRGFGFVTMGDAEADAAIAAMNGKELDGRVLVVNEARPRTEEAPRRPYSNGPRRDNGGMGGSRGYGDR
jgi:RNA recognition motif-containing protein